MALQGHELHSSADAAYHMVLQQGWDSTATATHCKDADGLRLANWRGLGLVGCQKGLLLGSGCQGAACCCGPSICLFVGCCCTPHGVGGGGGWTRLDCVPHGTVIEWRWWCGGFGSRIWAAGMGWCSKLNGGAVGCAPTWCGIDGAASPWWCGASGTGVEKVAFCCTRQEAAACGGWGTAFGSVTVCDAARPGCCRGGRAAVGWVMTGWVPHGTAASWGEVITLRCWIPLGAGPGWDVTACAPAAERPLGGGAGTLQVPVEAIACHMALQWGIAAEATAISLALNYYQHMGPVHHDVVVYSDSMSCLQAIEGEDTENPFICHIMNLLWSLSDKGTRVLFCWVPSHCGIDGNERVDQLAKETLDQDIDPLASVHYTDMKPLVNSYIQKLVQIKWDVAVHGRDLYLVKPTLGPRKKFQHLTRAEEVVITRLRIGHTKATKSHILSRGPPTGCHHCGQTLTIDHMLLECALLQECRDEYYTVDLLNALFETIPETCIIEFLREAGFFYLIWCNLLTSNSPQTCTIWSDLSNYLENESNSETHLLVWDG